MDTVNVVESGHVGSVAPSPDLYLEFKLFEGGTFEEVFNGPGRVIYDRYRKRKGIGKLLLSFPISELKEMSRGIPNDQRVPRRCSKPTTRPGVLEESRPPFGISPRK